MRRLKQNRLQTMYVRPKTVTYDSEGVPEISWGTAVEIKGEVWPATDRRQIESYGDRISGIQNVWVQEDYMVFLDQGVDKVLLRDATFVLSAGDGICVNAGKTDVPDYQVLSFTPYKHLKMEIERLWQGMQVSPSTQTLEE